MSKILIIIGLVLTGAITVPLVLFIVLFESVLTYKELSHRPDAPPISRDKWKSGL